MKKRKVWITGKWKMSQGMIAGAISILLLLAAFPAGAADFIDKFNLTQALFENNSNTQQTTNQAAVNDAIGNQRTLLLNNSSGASATKISKIDVSAGEFSMSVDSGVNTYAIVTWNNFAGEDLTGGGMYNAVRLTQISGDLAAAGEVRLTVKSNGNSAYYDFTVPTTAADQQAKFTQFTGDAANIFNNVSEITLGIPAGLSHQEGPDLSLDSIDLICIADPPVINTFEAVPNPIPAGEDQTTLTWDVTDPSGQGNTVVDISCVGNDVGLNGTAQVGPGSCTLTATNECSSNTDQVNISEEPDCTDPEVTFTADISQFKKYGDPVVLNWTVNSQGSPLPFNVSIQPDIGSVNATGGSETVYPQKKTRYCLVATTGDPDCSVTICRTVEAEVKVPTLSEWGMIVFASLMGLSALWFIRRRNSSA